MTTFTSSSLPNAAGLAPVAAASDGGNRVVFVGSAGEAVFSTDGGASWTLAASSYSVSGLLTIFGASDVEYGAGRFVATKPLAVAHSPDGDTWTSVSLSSLLSSDPVAISYGGGRFVVVSSEAAITSTDGISWAACSVPVGFSSSALLTYGSSGFIVRHMNAALGAYVSADGITFTLNSSAVWNTNAKRPVRSGTFLVQPSGATATNCWRSADGGMTWASVSLGVSAYWLKAFSCTGRVFLCRNSAAGNVYESYTDGGSWAAATLPVSTTIVAGTGSSSRYLLVNSGGVLFTGFPPSAITIDANPSDLAAYGGGANVSVPYYFSAVKHATSTRQLLTPKPLPVPGIRQMESLVAQMVPLSTLPSRAVGLCVTDELPTWENYESNYELVSIDHAGSFSGFVHLNGSALPEIDVRVYWRPSGQLIRGVRSDASGSFTVGGLNKSTDKYYIEAVPSSGMVGYNIKVADRVFPT